MTAPRRMLAGIGPRMRPHDWGRIHQAILVAVVTVGLALTIGRLYVLAA